jgi:hypothetical protein
MYNAEQQLQFSKVQVTCLSLQQTVRSQYSNAEHLDG